MARRGMLAGVLLAALTLPALVGAEGVTARVTSDSTHYLVGDWIRLHIRIAHPPGVAVGSLIGDSLGGFQVLRRLPLQNVSDTVTTGELIVAKYDSGTAVVPSLTYLYSVPGQTATTTVQTNPLMLTVSTVPVDTTLDIKDVKAPMSIPLGLGDLLPWLILAVVMAGAAYAYHRFRTRKKPVAPGKVYVPPARPAHVIALDELARLKERKLWQQGLVKQYYTELTDILRRYIGNRYGVIAMEETTDEVLESLRTVHLPHDAPETIERLLRRADLVKFAKHQPGVADHEESMAMVYGFVEKTTPAPRPAGLVTAGEPVAVGETR